MTGADVGRYVQQVGASDGLEARCVVTVGLGNRLRAGDLPGPARPVGTINLLCALSRPLGDRAMIEAIALIAEARAVAVLKSGAPQPAIRPACVWYGYRLPGHRCVPRKASPWCSWKAYQAGHLIGRVVLAAVTIGVRAWLEDHGRRLDVSSLFIFAGLSRSRRCSPSRWPPISPWRSAERVSSRGVDGPPRRTRSCAARQKAGAALQLVAG